MGIIQGFIQRGGGPWESPGSYIYYVCYAYCTDFQDL